MSTTRTSQVLKCYEVLIFDDIEKNLLLYCYNIDEESL